MTYQDAHGVHGVSTAAGLTCARPVLFVLAHVPWPMLPPTQCIALWTRYAAHGARSHHGQCTSSGYPVRGPWRASSEPWTVAAGPGSLARRSHRGPWPTAPGPLKIGPGGETRRQKPDFAQSKRSETELIFHGGISLQECFTCYIP